MSEQEEQGVVKKVVNRVVSTGWRVVAGTLDGILSLVGKSKPDRESTPKLEPAGDKAENDTADTDSLDESSDARPDPLPEQEAYQQAEKFRKSGDFPRAEKLYRRAIDAGEATELWKAGAPPAHYRQLAMMLYNLERDDDAVAVVDRYLEYQKRHGNEQMDMAGLRDRLKSGQQKRDTGQYASVEAVDTQEIELEGLDEEVSDVEISGLKEIPGVGESRANTLRDAGFLSPQDVGEATVADLAQVTGIGRHTAEDLKKAVCGGEEDSPVDSTFWETIFVPARRTGKSGGEIQYELNDGRRGSARQLAVDHLRDQGWDATGVDNRLWQAIALLLYWETIYAELPPLEDDESVDFSPPPDIAGDLPPDMYRSDFFDRRKELFEHRAHTLRSDGAADEIRRSFKAHRGQPCGLLDWNELDVEQLAELAAMVDAEVVIALSERIFQNFSQNERGLPDVAARKADKAMLAKAKSGDIRLSENQRAWLETLKVTDARVALIEVG